MREIALAHKAERDKLSNGVYVPREGLSSARQNMENDLIKVIIGPRRAGKSVFAMQLLKGIDFAYLNFDDERLLDVTDYDDFIKAIRQVYGETNYLLFDEIQNLKDWELFLNRLQRNGFRIVITGSNAHLLSRELSTHLTGRFLQFQILPFSFKEFLHAKSFQIDDTLELKERQGSLLGYLDKYINIGGFPEIVTKHVEPRSYLPTLFESILFKDIAKRYNVRYSKKLYDLGYYLITNHSCEFTYTRLKKILDFRSVHTVENYVKYISEAFIVFVVDRFSFKLAEQIKSPKKVYSYDTGMAKSVRFAVTPDTGKFIENIVAIELLRRDIEPYFYRTRNGKEIDFVIKKGSDINQLIQVSYDISEYATKKRELNALVKAGQELRCDNLTVITWDHCGEDLVDEQKVSFLPLWRWLLG
ncbi:MAG: ATP-binding protein [Desulfomonile sp.]|jgi:predicted AAA+ superfamily ATPase